MGNSLNLNGGISAPQHSHLEHIYHSRTRDYQFELWSILICRAISEYICHKQIYEKGIVNYQFRMWTILLCGHVSDHINDKLIYKKTISYAQFLPQSIKIFKSVSSYSHKPIYGKRIIYDQFQLWIILLWRTISQYIYCRPIYKKTISLDQFVNLPEDVQCIILSKLPLKEVVRTSVLSSKWRSLWTICPKLRFDGTAMFGKNLNGKQREQHACQFIDTVNAVLQQCHGKVIEELAIKIEFDTRLVDHLNNWVRFAGSSHTKSLAFDLMPRGFEGLNDPQYIFPFQLFDRRIISHLQLHFVSVKLPTQFSGFPKLRKLDLRVVKVPTKDLHSMLSNCYSLEWLSMDLCKIDGEPELKVQSPLPCLLYLNISFCELTEVEFHAEKLRTFIYEGSKVTVINLHKVYDLKNANISFSGATIGDVIPALANVLTNVQNLTFKTFLHLPKDPHLMKNTSKFSRLKCLQLLLAYDLDVDNLSLLPFLELIPFIEELEVNFSSLLGFFYVEGTCIRRFEHQHKHLKNVCITGFKASNGQIDFLVHIVENSPALESLTIDQSDKRLRSDPLLVKRKVGKYMDGAVYAAVQRYIEGAVSSKCSLRLLF